MDKKYHSIHSWLHRHFSLNKKRCEKCKIDTDLQFALMHGLLYEKNIKNYLILCRSCHWRYDLINNCESCGKKSRKLLCGRCANRERLRVFPTQKFCSFCNKKFIAKKNQIFCSTTCRVYAFYRNRKVTAYQYISSLSRK